MAFHGDNDITENKKNFRSLLPGRSVSVRNVQWFFRC